MQTEMIEKCQNMGNNEELIDLLIAISVVSKRLAIKLRQQNMKKEETQSD